MSVAPDISQKPKLIHCYLGCSRQILSYCKYFEIDKIEVLYGRLFSVLDFLFQVLLCLDEDGGLKVEMSRPVRFTKEICIFLPAEICRFHLLGEMERSS